MFFRNLNSFVFLDIHQRLAIPFRRLELLVNPKNVRVAAAASRPIYQAVLAAGDQRDEAWVSSWMQQAVASLPTTR